MFDLTKSTMSYTWAFSMFGLQQTVGMFSSSPRPAGAPASNPFSGLSAPEEQLTDLYKAAFEAGDQVQRGFIDSVAHYLSPNALYNPVAALRLGTELYYDMADALRFFRPDAATFTAWRELLNKVDVYQLVRSVEKKLKLPREGEFDLAEYVEKAYALGPYAALWAVEGLGHDYADSVRERGDKLEGILQGAKIANLPPKSLTMLHAGIGLAFAQRLMEPMNARTPENEVQAAVDVFLNQCAVNSEPGYAGAAIESLGLVCRTFHSELVPVVDRHLESKDSAAQGYFWHGAGRAIYFLLVNFLPYKDPVWRAVEMGRSEASSETARLNALAGTAWALTLVNMRQPQVMASFLNAHADDLWDSREAFLNGVTSSLVMRYDTSPDDPNIAQFRDFSPKESDARGEDLWEEFIRQSVTRAIDTLHPALQSGKRLEEVFRYQDLEALITARA